MLYEVSRTQPKGTFRFQIKLSFADPLYCLQDSPPEIELVTERVS